MTSNFGFTSSPYYSFGDAAFVSPSAPVVDVGSYTFSNIINTACYGPIICIAAVTGQILKVVYINMSGNAVDASYTITLPLASPAHVVAMKQFSKYEFRILMGTALSGMYSPVNVSTFSFYRINVYTNTHMLESSYTFPSPTAYAYIWAVYTDFAEESRSGDYILGYQHIQKIYTPGNYRANGHVYNGIVANIASASFGTLTEMFASDTDCNAFLATSHNGDTGFLLRMAIATEGWHTGLNPALYYFSRLKLELFEWTGFTITPASANYVEVYNADFDPELFITYDMYWPSSYKGPRANLSLTSIKANSFYFPTSFSSSLLYELGNQQQYLPTSKTFTQGGKTAYPGYCEDPIFIENNTTLPVTVATWIYPETGHSIPYSCFAIEAVTHNCYIVDRISKGFTQLVETGFDIKTVFTKLEQPNHFILCWAKRTADGVFGIMKFTTGGIYIGFIPVADTFYTEAYGAKAYFANGFIVVSNWCYYIGGPGHHNVVQMILEQN